MQYTTKIVTKIDESFIQEWQELWESSENANLFNSYEWFLTCLDTKIVKEYEIHVCYKDGKLVGLIPLQRYQCFGVNVYGSICREYLLDTPFLIENYNKTLIKQLFISVFKRKNIYLQKIDEKAVDILHALFPKLFFSLSSVNPILAIQDDPFENTSESTMNRLKKIIKKNSENLHFFDFSTNLDNHLETMFTLQKKTSKSARSLDIFANKETKAYYRSLTKNCGRFIKINFLYLDTLPIAYEYGFLYKHTYFGSQIAYHNEYKKFVPGKLIIYYLLDSLKNTGVNIVDQGGGISSYKAAFSNGYRTLYNLYYSTNNFIMMWWKVINKTRRVKQMLFPKKYTRDHEFLFKTL